MALSASTPHFFKIILEETLQENKLRIPKKFEVKYGETLSEDVFVKLPCGSEWKMKLAKYDDNLWLQEGWPEFLEHYTLKRGHLLVFRYEGNSVFNAVIFDKSTVEIDYPTTPIKSGEPDIGEEHRGSKGKETEEKDSDDILEDFSFSPGKHSPFPSSWHHKRKKMSHNGETSRRNGSSYFSKPKMKGDGVKSTTPRRSKPEILKMMEPLRSIEKVKSLKMARGFKSKNPSFKLVMQPSYVIGSRLKIPPLFAKEHLKDESGLVNLKVSSGKTWSVTFTFRMYNKSQTAKFYKGWKVFAQENNLDVGDVCVFVLTKDQKVSFEVTIFRAKRDASSPTHRCGGIQISSNSDNETPILGSPDFPTEQAAGGISTTQTCPKQEAVRRQRPVTSYEKAIILKRACFKSDNPFFKVVMQQTYTHTNSYLPVPFKFAKRNIKKNRSDVILELPDGRFWSAECKIRNLDDKGLPKSAGLYSGWSAFAVENNLEVGDVCIFELVTTAEKISFRVFIERLADDAYHQIYSSDSDDDDAAEKPTS